MRVEEYTVGDRTLWRVADMHRITPSLEASIRPEDYPKPDHDRPRLVVACGMGVDSWAILVEMHNRGIRPDCIQWADTGSERRHTYRAAQVLIDWLVSVDFPPLVIVRRRCPRAGHRGLYEQAWNTEQLPSPAFHMNHSCSIEWKLKPQRRWQERTGWLWPTTTAIGFDAQEVPHRKGAATEAIGIEATETGRRSLRYAVDNDKDFVQWYPLVDWNMTRQDCIDSIHRAGLPSPGKSACFMCPVSKACELREMEDDEIGAATDLETRFQDGKNFKGKYIGLASKRTWTELIQDDTPDDPTLKPGDLPEPELTEWTPDAEPQLRLF
jgi:hypothetical protein